MASERNTKTALPSLATFGNAVWGLPKFPIYIRWNEVCEKENEWLEKHPIKSTTNYCEDNDERQY